MMGAVQITVTGFEPFFGVPTNPTQALVESLPERLDPKTKLRTAVLPVDSRSVVAALRALWAERPAALIHLGVAEHRSTIDLETRAENVLDFRVPDNGGAQPESEPIEPGAPDLVGTRLPVDVIASRWERTGVPHRLSSSAGRFLCNQVMFLSLRALPRRTPTGFVHVPPDRALAQTLRTEGLDLDLMRTALLDALHITAELCHARPPQA